MTDTINFWRPQDAYGWLTNFSLHGINCEGLWWLTMEHFFQGMKTLKAGQREEIRTALTPRKAKSLGQRCEMRADWEQSVEMPKKYQALFSDDLGVIVDLGKDHYMFSGLLEKFHQHEDLNRLLLETGNAILVEASPKDAYWGHGPGGGGLNKLGRMLMLVRKRIRERLVEK